MPNIEGQKRWSEVRLLETHELARGGVNGNLNEQAKALADRTEFLNQEKASKSEIVQGVFEFGTYAEFNAARATLPLNCTVVINEENTSGTGTWGIGNNRWNGISLSKSEHDPLRKANQKSLEYYLDVLKNKTNMTVIDKSQFKNPGAYNSSGVVNQDFPSWRNTDKFPLKAGDTVVLESVIRLANYIAIIVFDPQTNTVLDAVRAQTENTALTTYTYSATQDCLVAFQHSDGTVAASSDIKAHIQLEDSREIYVEPEELIQLKIETLNSIYKNEFETITIPQNNFKHVGAFINGILNTGYSGWRHTDKIYLTIGETIRLHTLVASIGSAVLSIFDLNNNFIRSINSNNSNYADYTFEADSSCYVIAQHSSAGTTDTYAILNENQKKIFARTKDLENLEIDTSKVYAARHNDSLFDFSQMVMNSYVEANGVFTNNSAYPYAKRSPYIEVEPSTEYEFSFIDIGSLCAEYDENYVFIKGTQGRITNKITTTATTKYIVVNVNTDVVDEASYYFRKVGVIGTVSFKDEVKRIADIAISEDQNTGKTYNDTRFTGKTLLVAGDSITEQGSYAAKYWHGYLKDWFGLSTIKNEAKSGSGLIKSSTNAGSPKGMCYRLANWQANYGTPDMILIMGNMNDGTQKRAGDTIDTAAWDWVFGPNDIHKNDFTTVPTIELAEQSAWMALRYLFESIITMYPNVPVGFIISTPRSMTATKSGTPRSGYTTKCWGKTSWFEEWVDMINMITGHYSIPALDLYHSSNFRPWNATNNNTVFVNDGIHPNTLGHQLMAQKIAEFMKQFV